MSPSLFVQNGLRSVTNAVPCADGVDTINKQDLDLVPLKVSRLHSFGTLVHLGQAGASPAGRAKTS